MPYPVQVTGERILAQAQAILEHHGEDALTMARLAGELGIKAPSLYNHFPNKAALLRGLNQHTYRRLVAVLREVEANAGHQANEPISAMMHAYRQFARDNPLLYRLAFVQTSDSDLFEPADYDALAAPLQARVAQITGEADSLPALRGLWALVHGFVLLEMSSQFNRVGDVDAAFGHALTVYLRGMAE